MMIITYIAFVVLSIACAAITKYTWNLRGPALAINNPNFTKFQRQYFSAYFLALVADWLQGPYLYRLYRFYGFVQLQIAALYVFGYAAGIVFGTWAPLVANKFGRRNLCVSFTIIYSASCFMKLSGSYGLLLIGRILDGAATSLLFSSYEAWYIHEHVETHDFPKEWIAESMKKISMWNGSLAVISGVIANTIAEWFGFGPIAPFMLAVPCLLISGIIIMTTWSENYGNQNTKFRTACVTGLREIGDSPKIWLLGSIQALYESVVALIIFLWTPVLAPGRPPLGMVFSSFMVCIMIGTSASELITKRFSHSMSLMCSITMAFLACCMCALFSHRDHVNISFIALLIYQISVGIYFSAASSTREEVIPENHAISMTSWFHWFRVPVNVLIGLVLLLLRDERFRHGNRLIFIICSVLLFCALVCLSRLLPLIRKPQSESEEETEEVVLLPTSSATA